jgi:hypothetical protein
MMDMLCSRSGPQSCFVQLDLHPVCGNIHLPTSQLAYSFRFVQGVNADTSSHAVVVQVILRIGQIQLPYGLHQFTKLTDR